MLQLCGLFCQHICIHIVIHKIRNSNLSNGSFRQIHTFQQVPKAACRRNNLVGIQGSVS